MNSKQTVSHYLVRTYTTIIIVMGIFVFSLIGCIVLYQADQSNRMYIQRISDVIQFNRHQILDELALGDEAALKMHLNILEKELNVDLVSISYNGRYLKSDDLYEDEKAGAFELFIMKSLKIHPYRVDIANDYGSYPASLSVTYTRSMCANVLQPLVGVVAYLSLGMVMLITVMFMVLYIKVKKTLIDPLNRIVRCMTSMDKNGSSGILFQEGLRLVEIETLYNAIKKYETAMTYAALGQSTAMIAHDIRKPFASMKSLLKMLPEKKDDPAFVDYATAQVNDSIRKAESMMSDVLDYSRNEKLETAEVGVQGMISSALGDVFKNAGDSDVSVEYSFSHSKRVNIDEVKMARVLANIVENAVAAMDGKGRLWVETRDVNDGDKDSVQITLANDGPRIDDEALNHLFEPFFTKGKCRGTGLGLAICHKIVMAHNGKIQIESDDERTSFIITIPAGTRPERIRENELIRNSKDIIDLMPIEPEMRSLSEDINLFMDSHRKRGEESYLLIVDDEPLFRETIRALINRIPEVRDNLKVVEADSAEVALKQFEVRAFDYVISDIDMGRHNVDGYEFVSELLDKYPETLCLIHSNKRTEVRDNELIGRNNFQGFLPKPMDEGELVHFLSGKVFEQRRRYHTLGAQKRILVVNDEDFMRMAVKHGLEKSGEVQVLEACGVSHACKIIEGSGVDIILADINLNDDQDGYDLLRKVKKGNNNVKFYIMSGMSKDIEWPKAKSLGADGYIQVPYDEAELQNIIKCSIN